MLQINPSEFLRIGRLINNSLNLIDENIRYIKKNNSNNEIDHEDIKELNDLITVIKNDTNFLTKIIIEFEKATGEDIDKLLSKKYSDNFYKDKLLSYYANMICNNKNSKELETLSLCEENDEELSKYCQRQNFINNYESYLNGFDPEKFGLTKEEVKKELIYIYDNKGPNEAYSIMRALVNNCPKNYDEYHFAPKKQINSNGYYDYNKKTIDNYITNSEVIDINGYEYEFAQVLPKDCTNVEYLAYNFAKANTINTMRTLPNKYLELCSKGNSNTIVLTSSNNAMNNDGNWSGYYKSSSLFSKNTNMIVIDAHGSFNNNEYYTQNTIIHEMGHKFDDMIYSKNIIDKLFGKTSYTAASNEWKTAYDKYKNVINSINTNGYESYPNVNEFFSDATVAYFKDPDAVKTLCPEVYNLMNKMLDGEYGFSYNEKITEVLTASTI